MPRIPTCPFCGSKEVTHDALSRFNPATDQWEVSSLLDSAGCDDCCEEIGSDFKWIDQPKEE